MDKKELQETPVWVLFEKGRNYHHMVGIFEDTDRNYRMYNGDQWAGAKLGDVEPIQKNFIKPIVKYKLAVLHDNLFAVVFSSMNFENQAFRRNAEYICQMLNNYESRIWEQDKRDSKLREVTSDSAINGEGILYIDYDTQDKRPRSEVLKKNDVYYGNENNPDIQTQPYILIRKRLPVSTAIDFALEHGLPESKTEFIRSDNDTFEQSGESAKQEVDDMVTIVYKLYRKEKTVHFSIATRWITIAEDVDIGITLYPLAHMNWERKEGSARSDGEVKWLIPNQIEVNKTEMRRVLTVKSQAYPHKVIDETKISNPDAINAVGGVLKTKGQTVDDVRKVVGTLTPATMSQDVKLLQDDLIQFSRELAGAGDSATGQVNPESASGRAILAVQQASRAPMTEQRDACQTFIEDVARIELEYIILHANNGLNLEMKLPDPRTGQETVRMVNVPKATLQALKATVRIDITPKSVYDRYAQEQTLENFLQGGFLTPQRAPELKIYAELLDDDSVAPKQKLLDAANKIIAEQRRIAEIEARAQSQQLQTKMFLQQGPKVQASQISEAQMRGRVKQAVLQAMAGKMAKAAQSPKQNSA
jgi:hypothetical protein